MREKGGEEIGAIMLDPHALWVDFKLRTYRLSVFYPLESNLLLVHEVDVSYCNNIQIVFFRLFL